MAQSFEYNETTDLYLDILHEAQKIEDKKLIRMIKDRLVHCDWKPFPASEECEIIPFPGSFPPTFQTDEECRFWPKLDVLQMLLIFLAYLILVSSQLILW